MNSNISTITQRIPWIDVAKGLAMLLVVLGHTGQIPKLLHDIIFSFHMPLFFILSGYTYKYNKNNVKKDFKHLIIPYCTCIMILTIFQIIRITPGYYSSVNELLISATFGSGSNNGHIKMIGAIWFLPALFFAKRYLDIIFSCRLTDSLKFCSFIVIGILGILLSHIEIWLPLNIDVALIASEYMYFGYLLKTKWIHLTASCNIGRLFIALLIWIISIKYDVISLSRRDYSIWYITLLGALAGSYLFIFLCHYLTRFKIFKIILSFIGQHSLLLLCIHDLDWRMPIGVWGGNISKLFTNSNYLWTISFLRRLSFDLFFVLLFVIAEKLIQKNQTRNNNR